jgi:outer membrane protein assembly factor BamB
LLSVSALASDWPHFLGPQYDQTSKETNLLHDWPSDGPKKLWEYAKGSGHAAPAISQGVAVLFHSEGNDEIVDAIDVTTGQRKWRFSYAAPYTPQFGAGPGPRTNPIIEAGKVFVLGIAGALHCLDLAKGEIIWKRDLAREYRLLPTFFGQGGTPLVVGDHLVVSLGTQDEKAVVALDKNSGHEIWAAKHSWGSSYSSPVPAIFHGRRCILAFQGGMDDPPTGGLLIIDAKTGGVLAAIPHRAKMFASVSVSSPVVSGDRIFIGEAYTEGGLCVEVAPDFSTKVAWRAPKFGTYLSTAIAHDGFLFGFAGQHQRNSELVCYEIETGRELWRDDLGGKFQRGSLLRADGQFLCLGENGDLAWLKLNRAGAKTTRHTKLLHAPETWSPPVLSDGRLFICQNQPGGDATRQRLICYDLRGR